MIIPPEVPLENHSEDPVGVPPEVPPEVSVGIQVGIPPEALVGVLRKFLQEFIRKFL